MMNIQDKINNGTPFTWADLKEFVNLIPDHQLSDKAIIVNPDVEPIWLYGYFREDLMVNKHDNEDCYLLSQFEYEKDDFIENPDDYELDDSRPPMLTTDLDCNP